MLLVFLCVLVMSTKRGVQLKYQGVLCLGRGFQSGYGGIFLPEVTGLSLEGLILGVTAGPSFVRVGHKLHWPSCKPPEAHLLRPECLSPLLVACTTSVLHSSRAEATNASSGPREGDDLSCRPFTLQRDGEEHFWLE